MCSEFNSSCDMRPDDKWFLEQVRESLDDSRPNIPHTQVQREMSEKKTALRKQLVRTGIES